MEQSRKSASRRGFVTGSVTIGAAAAAATALPLVRPAPAIATAALPKPERGGGYSLSEHVKRYYKTTRI